MGARHEFVDRLAEAWSPADQRVVVAVSGGPDSVALLRGLAELRGGDRRGLTVAHLNHELRGAESDGDEAFVRELATRLELECDVARASELQLQRLKSAAEARELRYRFLRETAERRAARYVAVAHTADDQAETILHRILRGTGLAGLRGIPARRRLGEAAVLVRPALAVRRALLLEYLQSIGQPYCEDSSNLSLRAARNRLRHTLLPELARDYNPRVIEALLRLGAQAEEFCADLESRATEACEAAATVRPDGWDIDCRRLASYPPGVIRASLARLWRQAGWPERAMGLREWRSLVALVLADERTRRRRHFPGAIDAERLAATLRLRATRHSSEDTAP